VEVRQILVGHPTGNPTALSDVDRHLVFDQRGEQVTKMGQAHPVNLLAGGTSGEIRPVARQHH
jgi:hypothetical protein